ncbi:MAG TPA: histidine kinase [Candidatus Limnocylindrales bacterium]
MTEPDAAVPAVADEVAALERELSEIELLIGQARTEAARHDGKRAQITEKVTALGSRGDPAMQELVEASNQLLALTRRATLMEAQVDVLEGKQKVLGRFRESLQRRASDLSHGTRGAGGAGSADGGRNESTGSQGLSRVVLSAQEDLRREIARAMHDGPAQSLTNIVLQAQIVERILERDPTQARNEVHLLVGMVQQTLEATKSFIFDVRPMVLDDLGLVPTLRRSARERSRRAGIPIEFESLGTDRRLTMELESGLFRILDEGLAAYLSVAPERVSLRLDWGEDLEARLSASRVAPGEAPAEPAQPPQGGDGKELPPALAAMMEDRRADHVAAVEAARVASIAVLPTAAWRSLEERATTLGASAQLLDDGGQVRIVVPLGDVPQDSVPGAP